VIPFSSLSSCLFNGQEAVEAPARRVGRHGKRQWRNKERPLDGSVSLAANAPQAPEINKEAVVQVLSEGQCIKHDQYGYGIVAESDGERTTIDFDSVGMKKFVTGLMAMELVGDAAAARRLARRQPQKLRPPASNLRPSETPG